MWSWYVYAWGSGGFGAVGGVFSVQFLTLLVVGAASVNDSGTVVFFGVPLLASSYIQMLNVVSVLLQLVVSFVLGPMADFGSWRKIGLMVSAWTSAAFVFLVWICTPRLMDNTSVYTAASAFFIVASVSNGLNAIYFSAYLPVLARNHIQVLTGESSEADMNQRLASFSTAASFAGSIAALVLGVGVSLAVSSGGPPAFARALGSNATNTTAIFCASQPVTPPTTGELVQFMVVLSIAASWIIIFTLPALFWLLPRRGLPLTGRGLLMGWKQVGQSVVHVKRQSQLLLFLLAYFLYWDGVATLLFTSTVLFQTVPDMSSTLIGVAVVCAFLSAGVSSVGFFFLKKRFPVVFRSKNIIFGGIVLCCGLPLWGYFGLRSVPEIMVSSIVFGVLLGAISSHVRSAYSQMIPVGRESEYWTLFSIVDKASAFLGPFVLVFVNQASCNLRLASFSVLGFLLVGLLALVPCDFERGVDQGKAIHDD